VIYRIRRPDGSNHDIDIGPGPVGAMRKTIIGGTSVALAERPALRRDLDLSQNPRLAK